MDRKGVADGMKVQSADGKSLGKVVSCGESSFMIEKGFFFPKDYTASYDAVSRIEGDQVWLAIGSDQLLGEGARGEAQSQPQASAPIGAASAAAAAKAAASAPSTMAAGASQEVRVPLAEEELTAEKRSREAGRVEIRKEVKTEQKQVTVPVTKEEVHVERVPVSPGAPASEATSFKEGTVSVPVREEEVEIKKRPVVREEVRVSRTGRQEEVRAGAEVRKEEARIAKEGDVEQTSREEPEREK